MCLCGGIVMSDKKNGFQKLDEFIEKHNAKRRKYLPFLIAITIGIALVAGDTHLNGTMNK
jgi:hypothetical protein